MAAQPDEGYVYSGDDIELFYRIAGTAGDTVLVVHGGPGFDHGYLAPDLEPLAQSQTLIHYDQRGAGRSTIVSEPQALHLDAHIADLDAVRQHVGVDQMIVLGHSWGAVLAARYALAYPERVTKLILVSPGPLRRTPYDDEFLATVTAWMDEATLADIAALMASYQDPASDVRETCRAFFARFNRGYFYDPSVPTALERMRGDFCGAPDEALRNVWTVNALTMQSLGDYDWRSDFGHLSTPTLVVTGVRDVFPLESFHEWMAAFSDARLVLLDGAGHYPHVEQPEAFFDTVTEFLRRVELADLDHDVYR